MPHVDASDIDDPPRQRFRDIKEISTPKHTIARPVYTLRSAVYYDVVIGFSIYCLCESRRGRGHLLPSSR